MSDIITIQNGRTGRLQMRGVEYHVGIRERGDRVEVAYQGTRPGRLPIGCALDGVEMEAIERLKSESGWTVLILAPR